MRTLVQNGSSEGAWFFSNPSEEAKRERLRKEAEADLQAFLAKSGRRGRAQEDQQPPPDRPAAAPLPQKHQSLTSSNPLLGVGERELRRRTNGPNPLLADSQPQQTEQQPQQLQQQRLPQTEQQDGPRRRPRKDERTTNYSNSNYHYNNNNNNTNDYDAFQPRQQRRTQRYQPEYDNVPNYDDDGGYDDDYFRSRLKQSRRNAPRRRRIPDFDDDGGYDNDAHQDNYSFEKRRYREEPDRNHPMPRREEPRARGKDEYGVQRRDFPDSHDRLKQDDNVLPGGNRRRSAGTQRAMDPLSYGEELKQQMARKKEREREEKMRERQEVQQIMENQRPAYAAQGNKPPPGGFSSLNLGGVTKTNSVPPQQLRQQAASNSNSTKSSYLMDLEEQIRLKKEREAQEKAKIKAEDLKKEQEMMNYNPFGKAGAGAPLRDAQGHIITHPRQSIAQQGSLTSPTTNVAQMQQQQQQQQMLFQQQQLQQPFQFQNSFMSQPQLGMFPQQPFTTWPSGYTSQFAPASSPTSLLSPLQTMHLGMQPTMHPEFGMNGGLLNAQPNLMVPPVGQPMASPTSQVPKPDTKFLRGVQDINNLPDWQRAEVLRKQRLQAEHEDELKRQIAEKQRIKELEVQKKREEEQRDFERIEREKRELQDFYAKTQDTRAIKAGGPGENGSQMVAQVKQEVKPMDKAAMKEKADEELREKYLQAQREAEELKKNKFKAKRQAAAATQPVAQASNESIPPPVQTFRSSSPPLPTLQKGNKAALNLDNLDESSVPVVPNPVPPKQNRAKVVEKPPAASEPHDVPSIEQQPAPVASKTPIASVKTNDLPLNEETSVNLPPPMQQARSPVRTRKQPQARVRQKSPIMSPPVDTEHVQLKTKTVLDQLSELKKSLELDQAQVMNDLRERSAPIRKFVVSEQPALHTMADSYVPSVYTEPPKIHSPISHETVKKVPPVLTNEPTFSNSVSPSEPSFGNGGPSGHALLDKIISNVQSEMAPDMSKPRPPIYGDVEESLLKRQEDILSRQQEELSRMRNQLNTDAPAKPTGQLASTSAKIPVTNSFDLNLMNPPASSMQHKPITKPNQFQVGDTKNNGRRRGSAASTIDLDAMDALNEARLKRLAALENDPHVGSSGDAAASSGVLLDFLHRKNVNGSRPSTGKSLFSESVLKKMNE